MHDKLVNNGIEFLIGKYGTEFYERVRDETLDQGNGLNCVGAQLEGTFINFMLKNRLSLERCVDMGFFIDMNVPEMFKGLAWSGLTETWKEKIGEMREFQAAVDRVREKATECVPS